MKIEEWADQQKTMFDRFVAFWLENHQRDPDAYPAEMDERSWGDNFVAFAEATMEGDQPAKLPDHECA